MKEYQYYLFDADGTLIDTADLIYACFKYALGKYNGATVDYQTILKTIGMPLQQQIDLFFASASKAKKIEITKDYQAYQFANFKKYIKLFPEIVETLTYLKNAGKKLAIVTSRRHESLDPYLQWAGIFDYFDIFVTPASTTKHKPFPEPALKALELLSAPPEEALFIGDAIFDIQCGTAAGIDTAFVLWSENKAESLAVSPTYQLQKMTDLIQYN